MGKRAVTDIQHVWKGPRKGTPRKVVLVALPTNFRQISDRIRALDSEKGVFWKRGLFRKVHFLEILENLEILEILENPQTVETKGKSNHFLEILENLEILEILEIPPVKRPLS